MSDQSDIAAVRQLIWDPPQAIQNETLGIGDARRLAFQAAAAPILETGWQVWVDATEVTDTTSLDPTLGLFTLASAPAEGAVITVDYTWAQLSDAAIDSQFTAANDNHLLAAARCLEVLLLDPAALTALRLDGISTDPAPRRQAIEAAIERYRRLGGYAQFQHRIDEPDWGA